MSGGQEIYIGKRFGHLEVIGVAEKNPTYPTRKNWTVLCDCGNKTTANTSILNKKEKTTCGQCNFHSVALSSNKTHGGSRTKLFRVWYGMLERCYNKKISAFANYGNRGILVCEDWRSSFENFKEWAHKSGYSDGLSLERINNDGNYCPENCKWATKKQQANNRRTNVVINFNGENLNITQWSEKLKFRRGVIQSRLKMGWSIEKILTTPIKKGGTQN